MRGTIRCFRQMFKRSVNKLVAHAGHHPGTCDAIADHQDYQHIHWIAQLMSFRVTRFKHQFSGIRHWDA
jgi:hypothetical protein